jgi:hypothetical protein
MRYYKIYHYSGVSDPLSVIDPDYCGTGVDFKRWRKSKSGINKSFFYVKNDPEECTRHRPCYEIYLPCEWKTLIYDIGTDALNLYAQACSDIEAECRAKYKRESYKAERDYKFQQNIFDLGYKGLTNSYISMFTHVIALFYPLPTAKPDGEYVAYNWNDVVLEDNRRVITQHQLRFGIFAEQAFDRMVNRMRESETNDLSSWEFRLLHG